MNARLERLNTKINMYGIGGATVARCHLQKMHILLRAESPCKQQNRGKLWLQDKELLQSK